MEAVIEPLEATTTPLRPGVSAEALVLRPPRPRASRARPLTAEVVLITQDSETDLARSLASIRAAAAVADAPLLIVDRGSADGTRSYLARHAPGARAVWLDREDGITDVLAAAAACSDADVLIILSSSLAPASEDAISRLVEHLEENPCAAVAAPLLRSSDGTALGSAGLIPTAAMLLAATTRKGARWSARRANRVPSAIGAPDEHVRVDSASASALAIRRSDLERLGTLARPLPAAVQELDMWVRLREHGREVHQLPQVEMADAGGRVTAGLPDASRHGFGEALRFLLSHPGYALRPPVGRRAGFGAHLGRGLQRAFDVTVASVLLVALAPLLIAIAVAIRLDSPGPAIFRQRRLGHRARPFEMYKFRTMKADADHAPHEQYVRDMILDRRRSPGEGAQQIFKVYPDPRVTRFGQLLRRTSLDELPQLFNVLRGDMTFVGFRPPIPYELPHYPTWYYRRFDARPGITGLWQVSGRNERSYEEMVSLDIEYLNRRSWLLDLSLLLRTVGVVLNRRGAY